jgi:colanic acid/amylovoran biosynthesis glycosyltransferase
MKKKVLHFVRKNSQLKASFIYNQINHHRDFQPSIVTRKNVSKLNDGGFADFNLRTYDYLDLSENETLYEWGRFKTIKTLSGREILLIEDLIKDKKIDICHFHYGTDCGVFYTVTKKISIPKVVSFYGYDSSSFPSFMMGYGRRYLKNRVFNRISAVLAMSPDMKMDLIEAGCPEDKIIVHYYGTDCKKFFHQHDYSKKNKIILLMLASLVPQKGHLFLLKSIKQLVGKGINNFELRIIGEGELGKQLKKYVKKNNFFKYVIFLGAIKYISKEMIAEYQNADIFVHPSVIAPNGDKEGIPGTIVEAMSAGLPVISTYHAGIPYIIENEKTGLLVKEWDVNGLSLAIEKLIIDRKLCEQLGKAGQKYAIHHLDIEQKELELEKIYTKLIDKKREFIYD